jgi:hypothetical protein
MSPNNSLTIVYDVVATTCSRKNRIIAIMFQRENCLDSKNQLADHSIIIYIYIYIYSNLRVFSMFLGTLDLYFLSVAFESWFKNPTCYY